MKDKMETLKKAAMEIGEKAYKLLVMQIIQMTMLLKQISQQKNKIFL